MFLYYPSRHQMTPKLRAFVDHVTSRPGTASKSCHLGEVDGSDIHGDGVNIAARLQELAKHDGIVVFRTLHDQGAHPSASTVRPPS